MKLKAFQINNYRSIKSSGWNYLAYDNITALIGQNESGKTSVLEALRSFYEGKIIDDILRSDMTMPVVSCIFDLEEKKIFNFIPSTNLSIELIEILTSKTEITLTREWRPDKTNTIKISDSDVISYYDSIKKEKKDIEERVLNEIVDLLFKAEKIFKEMGSVESRKNEIRNQLNQAFNKLETAKKVLNKTRKSDEKLIAEKELESTQNDYVIKEKEFNEIASKFEDLKHQTQSISEKVTVCKKCNEAIEAVKIERSELLKKTSQINEAQHLYDICSNDKEKRFAMQRLDHAKSEYNRAKKSFETLSEKEGMLKMITSKVFEGKSYNEAEVEVLAEIDNEKKMATPEEIGMMFLSHIPVFDFFEDFSSLLPNKIDLEDLLIENTNAEGYKAAKNFLIVAGLKSDFFREKNHRILKQKIENLNGEVTINFQDYWHQNVGKNNKIKLNFELEHYDYSLPEKSGKPYLEFWIKDKQERLYPKQRSRGVRWFLSFYLELKATAMQNNIKRVLLIDEPGLSLHARAQEDVLKVFEDLNDSMQIIYCTHSPHLIDINKVYRILAVQRADEDDENSESVIFDAKSLYNASSDTLSPIYSLMGAKLGDQQFINKKNNIILQDSVTYYYLSSLAKITGFEPEVFFIPASGISGIQSISNLLLGWKIEFSILLLGNGEMKKFSEDIKHELYIGNQAEGERRIRLIDTFNYIEDLFSTIDFKRFILSKRVGITETNSEYILSNNLSRSILASSFISNLQDNNIKFSDFDEESQKKIREFFSLIKTML